MTETSHAQPEGRFRTILGYASLGLVIFLAITAVRGYRDLQLARERAAGIEESIELTEQEIDQLGRKIERLRDDPVMLERLAREELGMVRPGEVVVLLEGPAENRPTTAPSSDPPEPESP